MKLPIKYHQTHWSDRRKAREQYIVEQDGKCYHCNCSLSSDPPQEILDHDIDWSLFPGGMDFLKYPIHLHHDHYTGLTIGAVHSYCNAVLFEYHGE